VIASIGTFAAIVLAWNAGPAPMPAQAASTPAVSAPATLAPSPAVRTVTAAPKATPKASPTPSTPYAALSWREVGPAAAGGRVAAVAGSGTDPDLYYFGATGGGVWKSVNGGQTCRYQRMHHAQRPEFHKTRRNLRRSDQSGGRYRHRRAGSGDFEETRQVRRHGAGDKPGRRKHESKNSHGAARRRRTPPRHFRGAGRGWRARDQQPVQRQPD